MEISFEPNKTYKISGDLDNYSSTEKCEIQRKIKYQTNTHIICECGRKFIKNENLKLN